MESARFLKLRTEIKMCVSVLDVLIGPVGVPVCLPVEEDMLGHFIPVIRHHLVVSMQGILKSPTHKVTTKVHKEMPISIYFFSF